MNEPDRGAELPRDAWLQLILGRPAGAKILRLLHRLLRAEQYAPADQAPWAAVHFGLAEARHAVPRAFAQAEKTLARFRRLPPARRPGAFRRARREIRNPALVDVFLAEARGQLCTDPAAALS